MLSLAGEESECCTAMSEVGADVFSFQLCFGKKISKEKAANVMIFLIRTPRQKVS